MLLQIRQQITDLFDKTALSGYRFINREAIPAGIQKPAQNHPPALVIDMDLCQSSHFIEYPVGEAGKTQHLHIQESGQIQLPDQIPLGLQCKLLGNHKDQAAVPPFQSPPDLPVYLHGLPAAGTPGNIMNPQTVASSFHAAGSPQMGWLFATRHLPAQMPAAAVRIHLLYRPYKYYYILSRNYIHPASLSPIPSSALS